MKDDPNGPTLVNRLMAEVFQNLASEALSLLFQVRSQASFDNLFLKIYCQQIVDFLERIERQVYAIEKLIFRILDSERAIRIPASEIELASFEKGRDFLRERLKELDQKLLAFSKLCKGGDLDYDALLVSIFQIRKCLADARNMAKALTAVAPNRPLKPLHTCANDYSFKNGSDLQDKQIRGRNSTYSAQSLPASAQEQCPRHSHSYIYLD